MTLMKETIAVLGLGYVGLPVALGFSRAGFPVIGYDVNERRIAALKKGHDWTGEADKAELLGAKLQLTSDASAMSAASFFIITVPTPIDGDRRPDLGAVTGACEAIGRVITSGAIVVLESTVYPGVTEEICGPVIARVSGLVQGVDFHMGYSPERINPGDREHTIERIIKVVSGDNPETVERVATAYGTIVRAGVHRAPSIKVAEAAKVIENTQRDLNIALMNELAIIFHRLGINTKDVLAAAGTKWNFLRFTPGLVGGHCIGVDPYYLTAKAEAAGYHPEVILAGRRINDGMGRYVAQQLIRLLSTLAKPLSTAKVAVLGLTFKEDVPDLRNSRVPDIVFELRQFGISPIVHDALADAAEAKHEYGIVLQSLDGVRDLDALILAVPHAAYLKRPEQLSAAVSPGGVLMDIKSAVDPKSVPSTVRYWSL
jgi:UDP-N-acetyl-D-glucosamine/UDP-N-acetyl-D-galactosamine dehydrogenase